MSHSPNTPWALTGAPSIVVQRTIIMFVSLPSPTPAACPVHVVDTVVIVAAQTSWVLHPHDRIHHHFPLLPLHLHPFRPLSPIGPLLSVDDAPRYRYGVIDTSRTYDVNGILWTKRVGEAPDEPEPWTMRDITNHLRSVYVGRIAYEYMHSPSKTERLWFSHILEASSSSGSRGSRTPALPGATQKKRIHKLLAQSETFDQFLQLKFPNLKRYGLEGGESMIPALDTLFSVAARGSSCFGIFIRVLFCSVELDISRCAAHRARHASSRPS